MTLLAAHARNLTELAHRRKRDLIIGYTPGTYNVHTLRAREVLQFSQIAFDCRRVNSRTPNNRSKFP